MSIIRDRSHTFEVGAAVVGRIARAYGPEVRRAVDEGWRE